MCAQSPALLRRRVLVEPGTQATVVKVDGRECVSFSSNDYLGLKNHPKILAAVKSVIDEVGVGSGASPLVEGYSKYHQQLEQKIARWVQRESALVFSSGYAANLSLITTLIKNKDHVYSDKLNHASLIDAVRFSQAKNHRYFHNDAAHLKRHLSNQKTTSENHFIVTDSVFSMDGDVAPLAEIGVLAEMYQANMLVDESHAIGILGTQGCGVASTEAPQSIITAGMGKACGVGGGFVAAENIVIEQMIQSARPYIYSTALSPILAAALCESISLLQESDASRKLLADRVQFFRSQAIQKELPLIDSDTPIQGILLGSSMRASFWQEYLLKRGFWVYAMREPTVPKDKARLRIVITVSHSESQIRDLVEALSTCLRCEKKEERA